MNFLLFPRIVLKFSVLVFWIPFIRKVIISEPPFEAVQFNIQYLQTDKRIAGTWVELAAYRKA